MITIMLKCGVFRSLGLAPMYVSARNKETPPVGDKIHERSAPSLVSVRPLMNFVTC